MLEKRPLYLLTTEEEAMPDHEFSELCPDKSQCQTCGCCAHGVEPNWGCHMKDAPEGVPCLGSCACVGTGMTWKQNNDRLTHPSQYRPDGA